MTQECDQWFGWLGYYADTAASRGGLRTRLPISILFLPAIDAIRILICKRLYANILGNTGFVINRMQRIITFDVFSNWGVEVDEGRKTKILYMEAIKRYQKIFIDIKKHPEGL